MVLGEPIGKLFFKLHADASGRGEFLRFLQDVAVYEKVPPGPYQLRMAARIYDKYVNPSSSTCISMPHHVHETVMQRAM